MQGSPGGNEGVAMNEIRIVGRANGCGVFVPDLPEILVQDKDVLTIDIAGEVASHVKIRPGDPKLARLEDVL